jgi:hypothetical protein
MKLLSSKPALFFVGVLIGVCLVPCYRYVTSWYEATEQPGEPAGLRTEQPETKSATPPKKSDEPAPDKAVKPLVEPADTVAKIGDYFIVKEELEKRLMSELQPYDDEEFIMEAKPPDAKTVLMKMLSEKAMAMEARKQNVLEKETVHKTVKNFRDRKLVSLLLQTHLQGKLTVSESEIQEKLKADPKLDRARAQQLVERAKARKILDVYYAEIYKKSHVKKLADNFDKAVQLHQRLLYRPKMERKMPFIQDSQIRDELTAKEKGIVLATFNNGKVTLKDWFEQLDKIAPPRRPKNLNTPQGVDGLLERTMRTPLLVSEAVSLGFDKDENLKKQVRDDEDRILLGEAKQAKFDEVKDPNEKEKAAYFNKNKEMFREDRKLKIDQIWCQDLKTAEKVKAELDDGKDFESVKQKYALNKEGKVFNTEPGDEGFFWKDLWQGDPNETVGPVKGLYRDGFKWRIVRILEKEPGKAAEYSDNMKDNVKRKILGEKRNALLERYGKELLEKYPYKIYTDRIKDINPLDIP